MLWQLSLGFADGPLARDDRQRVLLVDSGDGFNMIVGKIRALGLRRGSDFEWKALATSMKVADRLQAGEYAITPGTTPRLLLDKLARGEVMQHKFTIVEGWNFRELRAALQADPGIKHEISQLSDAEIMGKLSRQGTHPEGRFLPETYVYSRGGGELSLLARAAKAMDENLAEVWKARASELPLHTPEQLLTMASIVEKETALASERPLIASVFEHRLQLGMRLQTDPTVIYGMGSAYAGNIRRTDLETDTPYNTYVRSGLPPTPIAMPGKQALLAVAHPSGSKALYFVARGDGSHYFSADLAEHNAAVQKFQLKH
ncbi:MAG: endolytic transglycosylase MltG [Arenimonas sp.]